MSLKNDDVKLKVIELDAKGLSSREIALSLLGSESKKSTINDFLSRNTFVAWWSEYDNRVPDTTPRVKPVLRVGSSAEPLEIVTSKVAPNNCTHLMIPDTQVKPDINTEYLSWVGEYIAEKQPDVLVHIGDHFDLPSLSSYDKGTKSAEGRRLNEDIDSGIEGMNLLLKPLYDLQQAEIALYGEPKYKPKMVFTTGNHEQRLMRHVEANPELSGFVSYDNFKLKENGWEVYDFLEPAIVNGVTYIHYMPNPMSGKPYGGTATNILNKVGESFCMGHQQKLDVATRFLPASGRQQWAIIAGACYDHEEGYKGYTGNKHWRGVVVMHQVKNGTFNPMFVDLDYLRNRYE